MIKFIILIIILFLEDFFAYKYIRKIDKKERKKLDEKEIKHINEMISKYEYLENLEKRVEKDVI